MPFVHWLPKAAPRRWLIALYVLAGIEPRWSPRLGRARRVRQYFNYSVNETFYRSPTVVTRTLAAQGFDAEFVDVEAWRPGRERAARWLGLKGSSGLLRIWYTNFGGDVGLATSLHTPASPAAVAVHSR